MSRITIAWISTKRTALSGQTRTESEALTLEQDLIALPYASSVSAGIRELHEGSNKCSEARQRKSARPRNVIGSSIFCLLGRTSTQKCVVPDPPSAPCCAVPFVLNYLQYATNTYIPRRHMERSQTAKQNLVELALLLPIPARSILSP